MAILTFAAMGRAGAQTPVFTNYQAPINATVGFPYSFTFTATGSPAPTFSLTGTLPAGLTLNSATGVLSGTPTASGAYSGTVTASNGIGTAPTQAYTIIVAAAYSSLGINWQGWSYYFAGSTTANLPGRLYVPSTYTPTKSYPLVIFFHGQGQLGNNNTAQVSSSAGISSLAAAATGASPGTSGNQFFLYCPQLGSGTWGSAATTEAMGMAAQLEMNYNIDRSKVWVTGLSLGGGAVWYALEQFPTVLTGGVLCSGSELNGDIDNSYPSLYFPQLVNKPIWAHVNNQDPQVYPSQSWSRIENIELASGLSATPFAPNYTNSGAPYYTNGTSFWSFNNNTLQLTQYVSTSHDSWDTAYAEPQLYTWMQSFSNPPTNGYLPVGNTILCSFGELAIGTTNAMGQLSTDSLGQTWNSTIWGYFATDADIFPCALQSTGTTTATSLNLMSRFGYYFVNSTPLNTPYGTATINGVANTQIGNQGWTTSFNTEADFILNGLAPGGKYKLTFFGCYNNDTWSQTNWTRYKSGTQYVDLNTYNNASTKVVLDGVIADANGNIPIGVLPTPGMSGAGQGALNVLEILREPSSNTAPTFTNGTPGSGVVGTAYNFTFTASGSPVPTFSVTSGALPTSLSLNSTSGLVSGTPSAAGTFTGVITAANGVNPNATYNFSITVSPANSAPTISGTPTVAIQGTAYSYTFTSGGVPPPTFSVTAGTLPGGLSLSSTTGTISGTPTTAGTFTGITVTASNGISPNATDTFSMTVDAAPVIVGTPTAGTVGTAYSYTFTSGGVPAPTFSVTTGILPPGLSLSSSTGAITGTPTTAGTYSGITVKATNTVGTATDNFSITINPAPTPPTISGTPTVAVKGSAYSYTFTSGGVPAPTFSVTAGTLPAGLSLSSTTGTISGTPTTAGTFSGITVTASNGVSPNATDTFSMTVNSVPAFTDGPPASSATVGTAYSFTYTASGTPTPTFSLTAGSLPSGLTLSSGAISGTPTTVGTYSGTVTASNSAGSATQNFSITVSSAQVAPTFTYSGSPATTATVGMTYPTFTFTASGSPTPTYTVASGTLPPGLSLSSTTGALSGTPTTAGTYSGLSVKASNTAGNVTTSTFTITVSSASAVKTIMVSYAATTSIPSNWNVFANGSYTNHSMVYLDGTTAPVLYSQTAVGSGNTQEGGATFTTAGGVAVGGGVTPAIQIPGGANATPADSLIYQSGTTTFTLSGLDGSGATAYTLTMFYSNGGTRVVTYALSSYTSASVNTVSLTSPAAGGPPYGSTVSLVNVIPTSGGVISFTMATGNSTYSTNGYLGILEIDSAPASSSNSAPTLTGTAPAGTISTAYSYTYSFTGTPAPTFSVTAGSLPPGLSLNSTTAVISGTPTATGTYSGTITATNGVSPNATQNFSIAINQAPAFTDGPPPATATVGTAYSFTYTASGYPAPTFTLASGTLPAGITLSSAGVLSGTPTSAGTYSGLSVKATNSVGNVTTSTFTITVAPPPVKTIMVCYAATTNIPSNWNVFANGSYTNHSMVYLDGTTAPALYSQTAVGSGNTQEGGATFTTAGGVAVGGDGAVTPAIQIPGGANATPADSLIYQSGTTTFTLSGLDGSGATSYTLTMFYSNGGTRVVTYALSSYTSASVNTVSLTSPAAGGPPYGSTVSLTNVIPTSGGVISFTMATGNSTYSSNGYLGILEIDSSATH